MTMNDPIYCSPDDCEEVKAFAKRMAEEAEADAKLLDGNNRKERRIAASLARKAAKRAA